MRSGVTISRSGAIIWWINHYGYRHREGDRPAFICSSGDIAYYKLNELHRDDDKPAWIHRNGTKEWFKKGWPYTPKGSK